MILQVVLFLLVSYLSSPISGLWCHSSIELLSDGACYLLNARHGGISKGLWWLRDLQTDPLAAPLARLELQFACFLPSLWPFFLFHGLLFAASSWHAPQAAVGSLLLELKTPSLWFQLPPVPWWFPNLYLQPQPLSRALGDSCSHPLDHLDVSWTGCLFAPSHCPLSSPLSFEIALAGILPWLWFSSHSNLPKQVASTLLPTLGFLCCSWTPNHSSWAPLEVPDAAAVRRYPSSKVRSSGCALLEQPWRDTPRRR